MHWYYYKSDWLIAFFLTGDLPATKWKPKPERKLAVMLPKVESADHLRCAYGDLNVEGVEFGDLVPMVETRKGMDRISGISFEELFRMGLMALFESADGFLHVCHPGDDENGGVRRIDLLQ